jgi:hypothetical protein
MSPANPTGDLAIPVETGDNHVEDHFRRAACRFRSRRSRAGRRPSQDHASADRQERAGQSVQVKSEQVKTKTTEQAKTGVLNANAKMGRHHHKHHRSHKHMGALKTHKFSKVSIKHVAPAAIKRG